jgi:hypothetical protein
MHDIPVDTYRKSLRLMCAAIRANNAPAVIELCADLQEEVESARGNGLESRYVQYVLQSLCVALEVEFSLAVEELVQAYHALRSAEDRPMLRQTLEGVTMRRSNMTQ